MKRYLFLLAVSTVLPNHPSCAETRIARYNRFNNLFLVNPVYVT
ncbi:hypothetical protein [Legionella moravica]|uniref:Uncharacterized protein n=1 Tax=Legionella moravica TaxID=39962 RepID=A0A378JYM4_9GAMM|nr:hypothetical protein [Legionella moravica]STX63753.1 Uncharacterised protein [Legionella moravica]